MVSTPLNNKTPVFVCRYSNLLLINLKEYSLV